MDVNISSAAGRLSLLFIIFFSIGCKDDPEPKVEEQMFFPSNTDTNWETKSIADMEWNESAIQPLKDYLLAKNTKSFMILVNGRIVMEEYFDGHTSSTSWQWNSAGKTLVATTTGIAQQEGLLNINTKASQYLGVDWTSAELEKENLITVKNLLSMTSGLNDENEFVIRANLTYLY